LLSGIGKSIVGFVMKCKFEVCFLTPTKKEGMGVPNGIGTNSQAKVQGETIFHYKKKIVSEN